MLEAQLAFAHSPPSREPSFNIGAHDDQARAPRTAAAAAEHDGPDGGGDGGANGGADGGVSRDDAGSQSGAESDWRALNNDVVRDPTAAELAADPEGALAWLAGEARGLLLELSTAEARTFSPPRAAAAARGDGGRRRTRVDATTAAANADATVEAAVHAREAAMAEATEARAELARLRAALALASSTAAAGDTTAAGAPAAVSGLTVSGETGAAPTQAETRAREGASRRVSSASRRVSGGWVSAGSAASRAGAPAADAADGDALDSPSARVHSEVDKCRLVRQLERQEALKRAALARIRAQAAQIDALHRQLRDAGLQPAAAAPAAAMPSSTPPSSSATVNASPRDLSRADSSAASSLLGLGAGMASALDRSAAPSEPGTVGSRRDSALSGGMRSAHDEAELVDAGNEGEGRRTATPPPILLTRASQ